MYKLIFVCVLYVSYVLGTFRHELDLKDASPEDFPHHALVESKLICNGILLSENFVLTLAYCVDGFKAAKVYLGFSRYPHYATNQNEPNTQTRLSSNIFIHEDFTELNGKHYLNNIAIIKLAQPATLNNKVKPARLLSRKNVHLSDGRFVNITGWIISKNTHLKFATVRLRNKDTCGFVYGSQYLRSQELCIRWNTKDRLNLVGNSVLLKDEIIGLQTTTPPCFVKTLTCSSNDMILSLTPFLDWIAHTTGISEAQLTGQIKQENMYEQNSFKLGELAAKLNTLTLDIQSIRIDLAKFALTLDEQISDVRSQINISRTRSDQDRLDLEEEINAARTELTNGLSAQKSFNDLVAGFNDSNNDVQAKMDEGLNRLKERIEDLENTTKIINLENESRFLLQHENISKLFAEITDIESKQDTFQYLVYEGFGHINESIVDLYTNQRLYSVDLNLIKETYSKLKEIWHENFIKIEHKLDYFEEEARRNIDSNHISLANIKENLESQWHIMDSHIADEEKDIHYLKEKIKGIIATLDEISDFFHEGPHAN